MKLLEKHVVASVLSYVNIMPGCFFWRANTGAVKADQRFIRFNTPGTPDVLGCAQGRFVGIECKIMGNMQSALQVAWQRKLERAGGLYVLAYSVDDVAVIFKREGLTYAEA